MADASAPTYTTPSLPFCNPELSRVFSDTNRNMRTSRQGVLYITIASNSAKFLSLAELQARSPMIARALYEDKSNILERLIYLIEHEKAVHVFTEAF